MLEIISAAVGNLTCDPILLGLSLDYFIDEIFPKNGTALCHCFLHEADFDIPPLTAPFLGSASSILP